MRTLAGSVLGSCCLQGGSNSPVTQMVKLRLSVPPRSKPSLRLFLSFLPLKKNIYRKKTLFPSLIKETVNFLLNHNSLTSSLPQHEISDINKSMLLLPLAFSHRDLHLDLHVCNAWTFSFCLLKSCLISVPLLRDVLPIHLGHENTHHLLLGDPFVF